MEWILHRVMLTGLLGAFLLILSYKVGIIEYLQVNTTGIIHRLVSCRFCMGFWIAVILSLFGVIVEGLLWLIIPFFAASLIRLIE